MLKIALINPLKNPATNAPPDSGIAGLRPPI